MKVEKLNTISKIALLINLILISIFTYLASSSYYQKETSDFPHFDSNLTVDLVKIICYYLIPIQVLLMVTELFIKLINKIKLSSIDFLIYAFSILSSIQVIPLYRHISQVMKDVPW